MGQRRLWLALALAAATLAVYAPVRHYEFVNYDDDEYVSANPDLRKGLSASGIAWAVTETRAANWIPLTRLSWLADFQLHGLEPGPFHATNVAFHLASTLVLFGVLARTTGAPGRAAFVAGVFALHPLHVESVAWVSERKDVLCGLMWMLATWAYARYAARPTTRRYLLVASVFALALLAKPMAVTLPLVFLLLDLWPLRRLQDGAGGIDRVRLRRALLEKAPLMALSAACAVVTVVVQRGAGAVQDLEQYPWSVRTANALVATMSYLAKTFWPRGLAVFYPHPGAAVSSLAAVMAGLLLAGLSLAAVRQARGRPYLVTGWLWFLITLLPVLGLVQVGTQEMADRYTYLPLIGVSIAVAWGGAEMLSRAPHGPAIATTLAVAALGGLALRASSQVGVWRDSVSLFEHALAVTRSNVVAHLNLGVALLNDGRAADATTHLQEAARLHPTSVEARAALGEALVRQGRETEGIEALRAALRLDPSSVQTRGNLGRVLAERGQMEEAIAHLQEAVSLRPDDAEAHNNLGAALARQGNYSEAIESFRQAVGLRPEHAEAHNNWGVALLNRRELDEAVVRFRQAVALRPDYAEAHANWGLALAGKEDFVQALPHFERALALRPEDVESRYHAGLALARLGRAREAVAHFAEVIALRPDHAEAEHAWGVALASQGAFAEGIAHLRRAVQLSPGSADAHHTLGMLLVRMGQLPDAARAFEQALRAQPDHAAARSNLERTRAALRSR